MNNYDIRELNKTVTNRFKFMNDIVHSNNPIIKILLKNRFVDFSLIT